MLPEVADCSDTDTELEKLPPFGVIVGVATTNATAVLTLRVKAVVLVTPPPVAETVIGKLPVGVDPLVLTVNTVEQDGLQEVEEKDPVAPEGSPETLKETALETPDAKAVLIVSVTEDPAFIDRLPELEIE